MATRFRKSVKIAPGVRLNVSKSGISTSIGRRGATVNLSKRGTRITTGIPGTGLSTSKLYKATPKQPQKSRQYTKGEWAVALFIGAGTAGILAYSSSGGGRVLAAVACVGCLVGLASLQRAKPAASTGEPAAPVNEAAPPSQHAVTTSTWQERVAAIEAARSESPHPTPPSALVLGSLQDRIDHLADAAEARLQATIAEKAGDYDAAWQHLHDEKHHFLLHANKQKFSIQHTLALDSTVHEKMANILRKEKRHNDAFLHIAYWVTSQRHRPIKRHRDKFRAYYNRAESMSVSEDDAWSIIMTAPMLDFPQIQMIVQQWLRPASDLKE